MENIIQLHMMIKFVFIFIFSKKQISTFNILQGSRKYMEDKWTIAPHLGAMFGIEESEPTYFYGLLVFIF